MGIAVLGPLTVDDSGTLGRRDRVVLQALAVRQGGSVTADELIDAVWGDRPPPSAHKNLQSCVVRLRKTLGAGAIETTVHGYRLGAQAGVDSERFEAQVARARELLALGETDRVVYGLEQALGLWRGSPFTDLGEWPPARREAARLEEMRRDAEELLLDAQLRLGRAREVLPRAHEMVRAAPLRERRWELLALAQYRTGAQGEALRTIRQLRTVLAGELGIDPAPGVVALEQSILRQDPSLHQDDAAPLPSATCPWQGLQAYDVAEADRFFGRDTEIGAGLAILADQRLLALVGPSGSGKSSLMRAGIGARLQQRGTRCLTITPGRYPTRALTALSRLRPGDALLVDQAEELFTLCEDPDEARGFLDRLVEEAAVRPIVIALRADRLADLTAYPAFSRLVERGLYLVGGLEEAGLRLAVTGPAKQAGLILEPGLVDLLVTEVRDDPGALPLLSHALLETWKRREGSTLTVDGYRASGGIHGAVAQSAERLYAQVEPEHREALRELVLRLLSPGSEGEPVRTRVPRRLIGGDPEHERLIEMLVAARLVTSDDGVLEITHESLARAWPRLRGWLEDDIEGRRILHHLSSTADAWDTLGRPQSELYRGVRLTRALDWWASTGATLTGVERDFLETSRAEAEIEERSAAERARVQARLIRRLRIVLGGAAVLLVLALIAGAMAAVQSNRASNNAATALVNETAAEARRAGAQSLITDDIEESMLLAVAGTRLDDSPATRSSLLAALARRPALVGSTHINGQTITALDVSPDGRTVATYDEANRVRLHQVKTGELAGEFSAGSTRRRLGAPGRVMFSPDGRLLAVTGAPPTAQPVRLLDAATLEPLTAQPSGVGRGRWQADDVSFSGDGRHLAAVVTEVRGPREGLVRASTWLVAWDLTDPGRPDARIRLSDDAQYSGIALSPDGHVVHTTGPFVRHDLRRAVSRAVAGAPGLGKLALSPDGRLVVASLADGSGGLGLFDATTGAERDRMGDGEGVGWNVAFSADGTRAATILFEEREAVVWDVATRAEVARIQLGEPGEVLDLSADGSFLYAAGTGSAVRHWDIDGDDRFLANVVAHKDGISTYLPARPGPHGAFVAVSSRGEVGFFDMHAGTTPSKPLDRLATGPGLGSWHPDGIHFAHAAVQGVGDADTRVTVWDARRSKKVGSGPSSTKGFSGIDYSTDGSRLVIAEPSGQVTMLDATTLEPSGPAVRLEGSACCVAAGPDNRTAIALTGTVDTTKFFADAVTGWALLDLKVGTIVDEGDLGFEGAAVEISPDGRQAAVGGRGGEIMLLDLPSGVPVRSAGKIASDGILSVSYSPDGRLVLASGWGASVGLLDARTGRLMARVLTPEPGTTATFEDQPGSVLIATNGNGPVWRWDTDIDRAVEFACRVAGRDLTRGEWTEHFGDLPYRETCPR